MGPPSTSTSGRAQTAVDIIAAEAAAVPSQLPTAIVPQIENINRSKSTLHGGADTADDSDSDPPPPPRPRPQLSKSRLILIATTATFAVFLSGAGNVGLNIALPRIQEDLHMSSTDLQWVSSAYALTSEPSFLPQIVSYGC